LSTSAASRTTAVRDPERVKFSDLLGWGITAATKAGYLRKWPKHVIAAAHWTRADLSAMADFAEIKREFDGVQKTYVTMEKRYEARTTAGKHSRRFTVTLLDTQLLAPGTSKGLGALGKMYGFEKLDPGRTSVAADLPGRCSSPGAQNTGILGRLPACRPGSTSLQCRPANSRFEGYRDSNPRFLSGTI
jgi:hypothetical protein